MALRSTFREAATAVAWQRQLRDQHLDEGAPNVPLDLGGARVRPVSRAFAQQIILKYEWLGTMSSTRLHYGIFFGMHCAGVTCVAVNGAGTGGTNVAKPFGISSRELAILARGACVHWAPTGTNSKLVAWTAKLVARESCARVMIAYADTDAGEIGTIYQACNWAYIGRGAATTQLVAPNGRIYDQKIVDTFRRAKTLTRREYTWSQQRDALLEAGWTEQRSNPKHRYVTLLDARNRDLAARIEQMRKPYPKRVRAERLDSEAVVMPDDEGSASLTSALHEVTP